MTTHTESTTTSDERRATTRDLEILAAALSRSGDRFVSRDVVASVLEIPELAEVIGDGIAVLLSGRVPHVTSSDDEFLTTTQAAKRIGVSRPHLVKLLDQGQLRYSRTSPRAGAHRRISAREVDDYIERRRASDASMKSYGELAEELGV